MKTICCVFTLMIGLSVTASVNAAPSCDKNPDHPSCTGGGGGDGGDGGSGGDAGCASVDDATNFFPAIAHRVWAGGKRNQYPAIALGSADGSCRQVILEFPPVSGESRRIGGPALHVSVNPDGTKSVAVAWSEYSQFEAYSSGSSSTINAAEFTVDGATVTHLQTSEVAANVAGTTFDAKFSADGTCLVTSTVAFPDEHSEHSTIAIRGGVPGRAACSLGGTQFSADSWISDPTLVDELSGASVVAITGYDAGISKFDSAGETEIVAQTPDEFGSYRGIADLDVANYRGTSVVVFDREDGTESDGNLAGCFWLEFRDLVGNGIPDLAPRRGWSPAWTRRGYLSTINEGTTSLYYKVTDPDGKGPKQGCGDELGLHNSDPASGVLVPTTYVGGDDEINRTFFDAD